MLKWAIPAMLAVLTFTSILAGEGGSSLELKQEYFEDRNGVWNYTPAMALKLALTRKWSLGWEQELDVVSAASRKLASGREMDAVSGASQIELRHSESPSLTYSHQGTTVSGSLYASSESDYTSLSPAVSLARDFNGRNTTLGASWAEFFDEFRPLGAYAKEGGSKRIRSLGVTLAQSLTPLTLIGLSATWIKSWGYLGHPYNPPSDADGALLTEAVPDREQAGAVAAQIIQGYRAGEKLGSLNLDIRWYQDDWSLKSTTVDLKISQYLTEGLYLRLRGRSYQQTGTYFAKDAYSGRETYRTADIRFYPFASYLVGVKVSGAFPEFWENMALLPDRWDLKYDHTLRDTRGDLGADASKNYRYQLYGTDEYYQQGVIMAGLLFNL